MKKAYTLLEVVVVVGIMVTLSGMAITYYNNFTQRKQLELEAKKIADVLELARKNSSAGYMFTSCASGALLTGYSVSLTNATTYTLNQCCNNGTGEACNTSYELNQHKIQSNAVSISSGVGAVLFKTLSRGITTVGSGNPIVFRTSSGSCINVSVSTSGIIDVGTAYTGC